MNIEIESEMVLSRLLDADEVARIELWQQLSRYLTAEQRFQMAPKFFPPPRQIIFMISKKVVDGE